MTNILKENAWNAVRIGGSGGGYKISSQAASADWFNKQIVNEGNRLIRLQRYHDLDLSVVEVGRALDIMAEDISSSNADDEESFFLEYPDESKILKTTIKLLEAARVMWQERTDMEYGFYEVARKTLKYGSTFFEKCEDGTLNELPCERMVGYILDKEDETCVTHYMYDPSIPKIVDRFKTKMVSGGQKLGNQKEEVRIIPADSLVVFKVGNEPFGESILERVYTTARRLCLLEDAIVIYRVIRAPERRVFYIDVGNLQGPKRDHAVEKQRMAMKQKTINKQGQTTTEFDPHSMGEDFFIPTNSTGKGSRVETLPGGGQTGELGDVEYFARKLAAGLRIPFSMIDTNNDRQEMHTDMRIGQLYQVEMRYMGYIKRFSRKFSDILDTNFKEFCKNRDISVPDGVWLRITPPMSFGMYKKMELQQQKLNLASSTMALPSLSKRYVMQEYLQMTPEELEDNETLVLLEKGYSEEIIKKLSLYDRINLVYAATPSPDVLLRNKIITQDQAIAMASQPQEPEF